MWRKGIIIMALFVILLVTMTGTAAAESDDRLDVSKLKPIAVPTEPPAVPTGEPGDNEPVTGNVHPIVTLLAAYFGPLLNNNTTPGDGTTPCDGTTTPCDRTTPDDGGQTDIAQQIASYHEDGIGFGVLVKLYSIVTDAQETCGTSGQGCTPPTIEELVSRFQAGEGLGNLFNEFNKPSMLGVGQVRKALEEQQNPSTNPEVSTNPDKPGQDNNGKENGKGNDKEKGKGNGKENGKGNGKGHNK